MTLQPEIRLILVDDQESIHQQVQALITAWADITLVARGYNGEEAIQLCDEHTPDVLLMDISMPVMNGIIAARSINARQPLIKIVAMSGMDDRDVVKKMIQAGASGYVLKEAHPDELESTIRAIYSGKSVLSADLLKPLIETNHNEQDFGLSPRELQVLSLIAAGQTNAQIAHELGISQPTVRFHFNNILERMDVATRSEALVLAARNGLI